jgi:hypothetical protein
LLYLIRDTDLVRSKPDRLYEIGKLSGALQLVTITACHARKSVLLLGRFGSWYGDAVETLGRRFEVLRPHLNELYRRLWLGVG